MSSQLSSGGLDVLSFQQMIGGVPVFHGVIKVGLNAQQQVLHMSAGDVIVTSNVRPVARLSAEEAIRVAYRTLGSQAPETIESMDAPDSARRLFRNPFPGGSEISAEEVVFPLSPVAGVFGWHILLETGPQAWYEIVVGGGDDRLLFRHNLYRFAGQARIWKQSPMRGERELVPLPDAWLAPGQTTTTNNNADVYLDVDGNNLPDPSPLNDLRLRNGRAFSSTQVFDFPAGEGSTGRNPREFQAAALANAFYFVNLAHDYFYDLGFTERAANFQRDNFGRGGQGGDPVLVEAQDRLVAENASFIPTPEGRSPRMELGLFTRKTNSALDDLDSGYDGQLILHEYAHGVTTRLVGGGREVSCLSGTQSGAMGEGWSDYFAISFFNNPIFGAYSSQRRIEGLRRQSYENNRLSYESMGINGYEVHDDGEIWGAILWEIRTALGKTVADGLIFQALKLTPCNPSMVDARDALLKTDEALNGGVNREVLWRVFAERGLGSSASGVDGTILRGTVYNAAYDLPVDLAPGNRAPQLTAQPAPVGGFRHTLSYRVEASDPDGDPVRFQLLEGPDGMTVDPETGDVLWEAGFVGKPVRIAITDGRGGRLVHAFDLQVLAPLDLGGSLKVDGPEASTGRVTIAVPPGIEVMEVQVKDGTGDADLILLEPDAFLYGFSARLDTKETLLVSRPTPGFWEARIVGVRHYRDVSIHAIERSSEVLPAGTPISALSGDTASHRFYRVSPTSDTYRLGAETYSGTGNVNLYVSRGGPPVCHFDPLVRAPCASEFRSVGAGTRKTVTVDLPADGDYFATMVAFSAYNEVVAAASLLEGRTLTVDPTTLTFTAQVNRAPPAQNITLGGPEVSYTWTCVPTVNSGSRNWLRVSRPSGVGKGQIAISIDMTGLTTGTYNGVVTITAPQLKGSPVALPVSLRVSL
ncbi:MAG: M36 family metallopeptidase [Acidobacteria bacterium]|nr:M36 family metallopeptidase [Acidobacteriota bacterium]